MRFRMTVAQTCTADDLSISINVFGDCLTGGWNNGACCSDPAYQIYNGNVQVVTPITSNIKSLLIITLSQLLTTIVTKHKQKL